jgi:CTP:molybdopterin cytidylyltransferase MocA
MSNRLETDPTTISTKRGAVILAAGAGMRLGGVAKALLRARSGATFLEQIVTTARTVGLDTGVIVVGPPHAEDVASRARELGLHVVLNSKPERGMASSVALGFAAIADTECHEAWLWPVDHPDVTPATLDVLVAALAQHDIARPIVRTHPRGADGEVVVGVTARGGHPPLIARRVWPRFAACADLPNGARDVFASADVVDVAVDDLGCIRDIDLPADMESRP